MLVKIGIWGSLQSCWDHEMRFPLFLPVERRNDDVTGVLPPPNKLNCAVGRARFPGSSGPVILLLARSLSAGLFFSSRCAKGEMDQASESVRKQESSKGPTRQRAELVFNRLGNVLYIQMCLLQPIDGGQIRLHSTPKRPPTMPPLKKNQKKESSH